MVGQAKPYLLTPHTLAQLLNSKREAAAIITGVTMLIPHTRTHAHALACIPIFSKKVDIDLSNTLITCSHLLRTRTCATLALHSWLSGHFMCFVITLVTPIPINMHSLNSQ